MGSLGNFELTQSPSKVHWAQMRQLIEEANWTSDDHSVMDMLPYFPAVKSVFAVDGGNQRLLCIAKLKNFRLFAI